MDWISVFSFFESSDKKGETYNVGTYHLSTAAHDVRGDKTLKEYYLADQYLHSS